MNDFPAPLTCGDPARGIVMALEILGNIYENPDLLSAQISEDEYQS